MSDFSLLSVLTTVKTVLKKLFHSKYIV